MRQVFYTDSETRKVLIEQAEAASQTMLHDDFGVGPKGENRLTFGQAAEPPLPTARELAREAAKRRLQALDTRSLDPVLADLVELLR